MHTHAHTHLQAPERNTSLGYGSHSNTNQLTCTHHLACTASTHCVCEGLAGCTHRVCKGLAGYTHVYVKAWLGTHGYTHVYVKAWLVHTCVCEGLAGCTHVYVKAWLVHTRVCEGLAGCTHVYVKAWLGAHCVCACVCVCVCVRACVCIPTSWVTCVCVFFFGLVKDGKESTHYCTVSCEDCVRPPHPWCPGPPVCAQGVGQPYHQGTLRRYCLWTGGRQDS